MFGHGANLRIRRPSVSPCRFNLWFLATGGRQSSKGITALPRCSPDSCSENDQQLRKHHRNHQCVQKAEKPLESPSSAGFVGLSQSQMSKTSAPGFHARISCHVSSTFLPPNLALSASAKRSGCSSCSNLAWNPWQGSQFISVQRAVL